jgi:hypothetical protein
MWEHRRVQGSGFRVQDLRFRIQGSGFRVQGLHGVVNLLTTFLNFIVRNRKRFNKE